ALAWATVTTLTGSLLALVLAQGLVETFRGKGLVPDSVTTQSQFVLAVGLGAALTVYIATFIGMPVSTTHALTGGLVGAGLLAAPGEVQTSALAKSFLLPLLLSPLLSIAMTVLIYPIFRLGRRALGVTNRTCICIDSVYEEVARLPDGTLALARTGS